MSRSRPRRIEAAQTHYPCERCGVGSGVWCRTSRGLWSSLLHSCRFHAWRAAHRHNLGSPE